MPFVKTGGLADVVGALPSRALGPTTSRSTLAIPAYSGVAGIRSEGRVLWRFADLLARPRPALIEPRVGQEEAGAFRRAVAVRARPANTAPMRRARTGPTTGAGSSRVRRLASPSSPAGAAGLPRFDVVHAHDWQAGMTPVYLRYRPDARRQAAPASSPIPNIAFQGWFAAEVFGQLGPAAARLGDRRRRMYGGVSYLQRPGSQARRCASPRSAPTYADGDP